MKWRRQGGKLNILCSWHLVSETLWVLDNFYQHIKLFYSRNPLLNRCCTARVLSSGAGKFLYLEEENCRENKVSVMSWLLQPFPINFSFEGSSCKLAAEILCLEQKSWATSLSPTFFSKTRKNQEQNPKTAACSEGTERTWRDSAFKFNFLFLKYFSVSLPSFPVDCWPVNYGTTIIISWLNAVKGFHGWSGEGWSLSFLLRHSCIFSPTPFSPITCSSHKSQEWIVCSWWLAFSCSVICDFISFLVNFLSTFWAPFL